MSQISEKTLMPLGFVLTLCTFVGWCAGFSKQVEANTSRLAQVEEKQQNYSEHLLQIYIKLSNIEGKLNKGK